MVAHPGRAARVAGERPRTFGGGGGGSQGERFAAQLVLNGAWSWLFFGLGRGGPARRAVGLATSGVPTLIRGADSPVGARS